jgi:hypothetical protein
MPRGSGIADPGVQNRYQFFMMPRGSGDADPGAQNRYQISMMPHGSGDADPGAQNRYQFSMLVPHFVLISVPCFWFNTGTLPLF